MSLQGSLQSTTCTPGTRLSLIQSQASHLGLAWSEVAYNNTRTRIFGIHLELFQLYQNIAKPFAELFACNGPLH